MSDSPTDALPQVVKTYALIVANPLGILHVIVCNLCHSIIPADEHADHWNHHAAAALMGAGPDYPPWFANGVTPPPTDAEALGPERGITGRIPHPRNGRHHG